MSSNIRNAPLHAIQTDLGADSRGIVLAVSAFTVAMVMYSLTIVVLGALRLPRICPC